MPMDVTTTVVLAAGLVGLLVAPVLNVLIDRVPSRAPLHGEREGEAAVPLSWLGIPAQPWLLRAGRAAQGPLPRRWLAVELVTVATFATMAVQYPSLELIPLLLLTASLITVSVIDIQLLRIPDRIIFPTLALALPLLLAISWYRDDLGPFKAGLAGGAGYFLLLFLPHVVYPRGMGFGDVKLALLMGLYLGWMGWSLSYPIVGPMRLVLYALMLGCAFGVVFGLVAQIVTRAWGAFPFGPALAVGCYLVLLGAVGLQG
ncbi:MAG: prepilin peptidase [Acidimicrobiia bacterium]|nr:prepilin peptidase [Acidimicrobiia bacterium]